MNEKGKDHKGVDVDNIEALYGDVDGLQKVFRDVSSRKQGKTSLAITQRQRESKKGPITVV